MLPVPVGKVFPLNRPTGEDRTCLARPTAAEPDVAKIVAATHRDPFSVLGIHETQVGGRSGVAVRVFVPGTREARVVVDGRDFTMHPRHVDGFFEAFFPDAAERFDYCLRLVNDEGIEYETVDPYSLSTTLSDFDLYLLGEGAHHKIYEKLGAHVDEVDGHPGVSFAVWAPNATRVSVVGDFNQWDGRRHAMRCHPGNGIWDIFVPGLAEGAVYMFELLDADGNLLPLKADPFGFAFEFRPHTASIVHGENGYAWNDAEWMRKRRQHNALDSPMSVYEVHLGSWGRNPETPEHFPNYCEIAERLVHYVKKMGFTHVELLPVSEHPLDASWGYQSLGYYAPTSRFGSPDELKHLIDRCHQEGIGVIIDWVPGHFPDDDHGLAQFDGSCLYEHADPRSGRHPHWGTLVFNYGRNEVSNFLIGNALFWCKKYHIDGIRVDAVASMLYLDYGREDGQWLPNQYGGKENVEAIEFLRRFNEFVGHYFPGVITIAEESTSWPGVSRPTHTGGLGFTLKWNMGWMNDTLHYMNKEPIHRKFHHSELTFSIVYAFHENFMLPLSHDEVVHGKGPLLDKMPGDRWQQLANLRLLFGYMWAHPGKKLLFMGGEFAQTHEWNHERPLDWGLLRDDAHRGVQRLVADLNRLHCDVPALHQRDFDWTGFQWVDFHDADQSVISFLRRGEAPHDYVLAVCNFTPQVRRRHRVGVPGGGYHAEILNTDSQFYGGSNVGNDFGLIALDEPCFDFPHTLEMTLPPLTTVFFRPQR